MSYQKDERMEELLHYDKAKIRKVRMFRTCLKPDGFEEYVASYYKFVHGIQTVVRGGFDDEWIDVEWERVVNGRKTRLLVQCKRWSWVSTDSGNWYVKRPDVSEFYGNVADIRHSSDCEVRLIYATTSYFTTKAQEFCKGKRIEMVNYMDLLKMDKDYPLERFIEQRARWGTGLDKTFELEQLTRYLPAYADIETKIKEVRKDTVNQFEILQKEIEAVDKNEAAVPEAAVIKTDEVLVVRQTPREALKPEVRSAKKDFDADRLLRFILVGVAVLLTTFIILIAIAISLQRNAIATPMRPSVPVYQPSIQSVTVQKKKNRPSVRKKNVRSAASGASR